MNFIQILKRANKGNPAPNRRVEKTAEEWRAILSPEVYRITREKGTEKAFSSEMCYAFEPGIYACACCKTPLFDNAQKFKSNSGWPSFSEPVQDNVIAYHKDRGFGSYRIEAVCNVCDAHLGHVFEDGPPPTGVRFCINALALQTVDGGATDG